MSSQRPQKVAEAIKREVSDLLIRGIKDTRVSTGMVSVTKVDITGDLRHAKIFVSVYGSADEQEQTMLGLRSALGYIRSEIGKRVPMRFTPDLSIWQDMSLAQGAEILDLLDRIAREDKTRAEG
ncbi:MAG: 30S ribosome-binding factor RbfA [Candidatus Sericytochromatia bacterium]|nr:30S ribosome-binding factor RbfA [Candidatus Sericytochromatia bacterium]